MTATMTRRELLMGLAVTALPLRPQTGKPIIRTILRDVSPAEIDGPILIHEHLSLGGTDWGISRPSTKWYDDVDLMASEVAACKSSGVRCIVDMGTSDLGRRIGALRTIATQSNMLIVASGGLHGKSDYPPGTAAKTADQIAERWGAIGEMGTGTDVPMDAEERKALNAAAKLHRRTGLPIVTHVSDGCARCALEQVDLFEAAGVSLDRLRKNGGPGIDMTITNFVPRLRR